MVLTLALSGSVIGSKGSLHRSCVAAVYNIFKNVLIDIDTDINIFRIVLINIDIFKNGLIAIDIDIDILKNLIIDIDTDINICQKCRYIDN